MSRSATTTAQDQSSTATPCGGKEQQQERTGQTPEVKAAMPLDTNPLEVGNLF